MTALATLMPGFEGTELPDWVERRLREGMGGVCLFATNVQSPEQLRSLTDRIYAANPDAIVSIDEEGGDVSRLYQREGSPFPGNALLGRIDDVSLTRAVGEQVGRELREAGVNLTLAPDVDVNSNPGNPVIGVRSFGATPELASRHGVAWTQGVQSVGVAANAKHFPGHGDTAQDSHVSLPTVDVDVETLRRRELAPFAAAIHGGVQTIMSSHIRVPALDQDDPATFSRTILTDVLRGEMGFDGVIVSDALDMVGASGEIGIPAAAARALAAGCDLLCIGTANTDDQMSDIVTRIDDAIAAGDLARERVEDAAARNRALARSLREVPSPAPLDASGRGRIVGLDTARIRQAFEISDGARATLDLHRSAGAPIHWVRLEPAANIAVGPSPWGPFAAGATADATVGPDDAFDAASVPDHATVVVVGKDNHRHAWARAVIDALRDRGAIVVDMGWPDPDDGYADIATYGASRLVGQALLEELA
ncbi:glycoside hydrolase family 3 protein [Demequina activiva]|uniref:Sugar hydrolase n=1 Tax=Demequina activiva TaxID=1582364 RepID=A0A919Q2M0_9MICO|nr:glycoside hydrolase family 3 protein [Demequina activiva]GIG54721.1 sugar hydrolase [Demequina activiva]